MADKNPKVINSVCLDNSQAKKLLEESQHLVSRLVKRHLLPADLLDKQKTLHAALEVKSQPDLERFMDKLKLQEHEKLQMLNHKFINEGQLLLILPSLGRLDSKELNELVKLKQKYLV